MEAKRELRREQEKRRRRDNLIAARAVGVRVHRARLLAFTVCGFLTGVGGCLLGHQIGTVSPNWNLASCCSMAENRKRVSDAISPDFSSSPTVLTISFIPLPRSMYRPRAALGAQAWD